MELTCKDCLLRNCGNDRKNGHCYMWKNWGSEKICTEFRRKKLGPAEQGREWLEWE